MPTALWPATARLPSVEELVRLTRTHLAADAWFEDPNGIGGKWLLYEETAQAEPPYGVVLQRRDAGGTRATTPGLRTPVVIVRFETPVRWQHWDQWHYAHHDRAARRLRGWTPPLTTGQVEGGGYEVHSYPDTALVDPVDATRYSVSSYLLSMRPQPGPPPAPNIAPTWNGSEATDLIIDAPGPVPPTAPAWNAEESADLIIDAPA